jgi:large subunit ribosomal protein L28
MCSPDSPSLLFPPHLVNALRTALYTEASLREKLITTELVMAQICEICGKGPQFGNKISHAHNVSKRRWNVNLRPVKAKIGGGNKRIRVCTSCIKAGKIVKA